MKNVMLIICATFLHFAGRAQINLVVNPSFEQYTVCPDFLDEVKYCNQWMSLDSTWSPPDWVHDPPGVPEFCHTCATYPDVKIPMFGNRYARTGNGMIQLELFNDEPDSNLQWHDYLQGHLSNTLTNGHKYMVRYHIVMHRG